MNKREYIKNLKTGDRFMLDTETVCRVTAPVRSEAGRTVVTYTTDEAGPEWTFSRPGLATVTLV